VALQGAINHNGCVRSVPASLNVGTKSFAALLKHHCGDF
jgi:hypothetical protein